MPLKLKRSKVKVKNFKQKTNKKKSKAWLYRHVTKAELIKQYEDIQENGKYYMEQFEALRKEYLSVRDKCINLQENNRELASRNAALLHENEIFRNQLSKFNKDQLIKISGAGKEYEVIKKKVAYELEKMSNSINSIISKNDPFFLLRQEFEKSLSVGDITHLDSIATVRNNRLGRVSDDNRQERQREKLHHLFMERIDLTAMSEETSPIERPNGSTFSIDSPKTSLSVESSHLDYTTLLDRPINSTMIETPSFRRIVPKTPQLNKTFDESSPGEDSGWEYNSANIQISPYEPRLSTSLDSIQNFIPKTPLLTQPGANRQSNRDSSIISDSPTRRSYFNRLSRAFPEKTPDQSPVTSFDNRSRTSRRLMNSVSTSKDCADKNLTINNETSIPSTSGVISRTASTATLSTTTRPSTTILATQTIDDTTKNETQNVDSNDKTSIDFTNDTETMESNADSEAQGNRRSLRKRRKVCYREK